MSVSWDQHKVSPSFTESVAILGLSYTCRSHWLYTMAKQLDRSVFEITMSNLFLLK